MGFLQCLGGRGSRKAQIHDEQLTMPTLGQTAVRPSSSQTQAELHMTKSLSETLLNKSASLRKTGSFKSWTIATGARTFSESLTFAALTASLRPQRSPEADQMLDRQLQIYNNVSHLLPRELGGRLPGIVVVGKPSASTA